MMHHLVRAGIAAALLLLAPAAGSLAETTEQAAIQAVMHHMFDRPGTELVIYPVVVEGGFAVAGWTQAEMGGRAFLKEADGKWALVLCTGDDIRSAEALTASGVPPDTAGKLAAAIADAEKSLDAGRLKKLASFQGMVRMDGN
jgi:hypothetical protein